MGRYLALLDGRNPPFPAPRPSDERQPRYEINERNEISPPNLPDPGLQVLGEVARRLDPGRLFDLAYSAPEAEREVYRAEILRRAAALDGPPPNAAVHDMFEKSSRYCSPTHPASGHRLWRSVHGVVVCGDCHPPSIPDLVSEWLPITKGDPHAC